MKRLALVLLLLSAPALAAPPLSVSRRQHWTDKHLSTDGEGVQTRSRTIKNWSNYHVPGGAWKASAAAMRASPSEHPGGGPVWTRSSEEAPLQVWARDASGGAANRATLYVRRSDTPGGALNIRPLNTNSTDVSWTGDQTFEYVGIWDGTTLRYTVGPHVVKKEIIITNKATAPPYFEFGYLLPGNHTITVVNNGMTFDDGDGDELMHANPVWGRDSDTDGSNIDGSNSITTTLTNEGQQQGRTVLRVTPNAGEVAAGVGDIVLDPDVTISGTGNLEDTYVDNASTNRNFGGRAIYVLSGGTGPAQSSFNRIQTAAIPAALAYTLVRYDHYRYSHGSFTAGNTAEAYFVKASAAWVEGTDDPYGDGNDGSCAWDYAQKTTLAWNTAGCLGSGVDFEADATPPSIVYGAYAAGADFFTQWDLGADGISWLGRWKGGETNNGFVGHPLNATASSAYGVRSTEAGSNQPIFYIEYTAPPSGSPIQHGAVF